GEEINDRRDQQPVNRSGESPKEEITALLHAHQRCNPGQCIDEGANNGTDACQVLEKESAALQHEEFSDPATILAVNLGGGCEGHAQRECESRGNIGQQRPLDDACLVGPLFLPDATVGSVETWPMAHREA